MKAAYLLMIAVLVSGCAVRASTAHPRTVSETSTRAMSAILPMPPPKRWNSATRRRIPAFCCSVFPASSENNWNLPSAAGGMP